MALLLSLLSGCSLFGIVTEVTLEKAGSTPVPGVACRITADTHGVAEKALSCAWLVEGVLVATGGTSYDFTPPHDGIFRVTCVADSAVNYAVGSLDVVVPPPAEPGYAESKRLLGQWVLSFPVETTFYFNYYFNRLAEYPAGSGEWKAHGFGDSGSAVVGGYDPGADSFSILDPSNPAYLVIYSFSFTSDAAIAGQASMKDRSTGDMSMGFSMAGVRVR